MTTPNITLNPSLMSVAAGTFGITWNGLIQGMAQPDPPARNWYAGGFLASSETLPMWGGVGVCEEIPTPPASPPLTPAQELGGPIIRATSVATDGSAGSMTGFSIFNQNLSAVNSPQSEVPLTPTYGGVLFVRFGSQNRIAVACSAALSSVEGNPVTTRVSWDFGLQMLVPYTPAFAAGTITNAVWASTGGGRTTLTVGTDYTTTLAAGSVIEVSGIVNTGGASTSAFNGQWVVVSVTDATHIVIATPASATLGTYASGGTIAAGGGALPCKVLKFEFGNSMTVNYNTTTGFATWNRSGNAALILI